MPSCESLNFSGIGAPDIGWLMALEGGTQVPCDVRRVYFTYGVPGDIQK